jgi:hypothetical protein
MDGTIFCNPTFVNFFVSEVWVSNTVCDYKIEICLCYERTRGFTEGGGMETEKRKVK